MSNLRLNNLLYFIQCESYKRYDVPAFSDDISVWKFGAVVLSVYNEYCSYAASNILLSTEEAEQIQDIGSDLQQVIKEVVERYIDMYIWDFLELVCDGIPWRKVYKEDTSRFAVIPERLFKE